jgi:2-polyprenyl-6-methoxyphenol hydroxylase-like FAD-dependent oxidoreductase
MYAHSRISSTDRSHALVGVVGLTTAIMIQERGDLQVTIVAENLPSDPKSIRYTSYWAVRAPRLLAVYELKHGTQGADHVSRAGEDLRQQSMWQDREAALLFF